MVTEQVPPRFNVEPDPCVKVPDPEEVVNVVLTVQVLLFVNVPPLLIVSVGAVNAIVFSA